MDHVKQGQLTQPTAATLEAIGQPDWTPAEEHAYQKALEFYLENDCTDAEADEAAWQTVCELFPRLAGQADASQPKAQKPARLRPNEEPETMAEYRAARPQHTAADWIQEALTINNQHCSDDARAISNLLYCALAAAIAHQEARR